MEEDHDFEAAPPPPPTVKSKPAAPFVRHIKKKSKSEDELLRPPPAPVTASADDEPESSASGFKQLRDETSIERRRIAERKREHSERDAAEALESTAGAGPLGSPPLPSDVERVRMTCTIKDQFEFEKHLRESVCTPSPPLFS